MVVVAACPENRQTKNHFFRRSFQSFLELTRKEDIATRAIQAQSDQKDRVEDVGRQINFTFRKGIWKKSEGNGDTCTTITKVTRKVEKGPTNLSRKSKLLERKNHAASQVEHDRGT